MNDADKRPARGAVAGMMLLTVVLSCTALGALAGVLIGALAPLLIAGMFAGFVAGVAVVRWRFSDL